MSGTIVKPEEFHDALKQNVTDGWDMMVAYAQIPLNRSLSKAWDRKAEFTKLTYSFQVIYDTVVIDQNFVVDLGAPSLQFDTTSDMAIAILTMMINGTVTTDTTISGVKTPGTPKAIPKDVYQLQVTVPIVGITGNQVWDHDHAIKFEGKGDDQPCHLIFHFRNDRSTWDILGHCSSVLNDDTFDKQMQQSLNSFKDHFKSKDNTHWIDYKVAEVTNKQYPTDSDSGVLCPKSFTMSSQEGYLLVFITTTGKDGTQNPRFNTKSKKTIAPIINDYEASIVIHHDLFVDYVCDQMKTTFKGQKITIAKESTLTGAKLSMTMDDTASWDLSKTPGHLDFTCKPKIEYKNFDLTLDLFDNSNFETKFTWTWAPELDIEWYEVEDSQGINTHQWGDPASFFTIDKEKSELQMACKISRSNDKPKMDYKAKSVGNKDAEYYTWKGSDSIPNEFDEDKDDVQYLVPSDMDFVFQGLNYFSAQNVFVPGVKFIEAKTEMMPYDVVLLGTMPEQPDEPTGYRTLPRRMVMDDYATDPIQDFLEDIYSNGYFMGDLIHHITNSDPEGVCKVIQDRGFENLDPVEVHQALQKFSIPGPDFDVRYAGGSYQVQDTTSTPVKELFVHSRYRDILLDDQMVLSQQTQSDGSVTFTSHDGQRSFQVLFNVDVDSDSPCGGVGFEGTSWSTAEPEQKTKFSGQRVFPWKDSPSLRKPKAAPMVDSATDAEALQYLSVAMDLTAPDDGASVDGKEPVEFAEPITIFFGAVSTALAVLNIQKWFRESKGQFVDAYARFRKIVLRKSGNSMGYGLKMPSVEEMQKSFTSKSEPIINTQINEGVFEKEKIIENSQSQILEEMKKSISVDSKFKSKKKYGTAFQLDEQMGMALVEQVVNVYADQVFQGDDYEEFMGTVVDRLLTVHDKDAAIRDGRLIAQRVSKLTNDIKNLQAEQLNLQQELRSERTKAQEEHWSQEQIDRMEADFDVKVQKNIEEQTKVDTERLEKQGEGKESDKKVKELLEEMDKKMKEKEKAEKKFWHDK
ncbi:hypothetical protein BcDW1_1223 [Botrytis cinerea BcDW1]|uniref:Uncharacterized protein n=1 Tax=Botryotinia fuckeliana (strain BcDW1) TaxID=1290391 RepID=M7U2H8_BOTF1|nr:hypothetical protein BcDW1_1223 [Botrytis cinerea BcDW1]